MSTITPARPLPAKPLSFGHEGRLDFYFWRMHVLHPLIFIGALGFSLMAQQYGLASYDSVMGALLIICVGMSIVDVVRTVRRNHRDYLLFLKSSETIDGAAENQQRFSTGIDRRSPIMGGLMGELKQLAVCLIIAVTSRPVTQTPGEVTFFIFAIGIGILSLIQIALMPYRSPRIEELIVTQRGLLRLNRESSWSTILPNEFLPWACIRRIVVSASEKQLEKTFEIEGDRWPWYQTIRFTNLCDEDWERMLKAIGEQTEVVREENS